MTPIVLFAASGTTCEQAQVAFKNTQNGFVRRFGGVANRWTYTSEGVRRKLEERGEPIDSPRDALTGLLKEGFTQVAVLSLHITPGVEYTRLKDVVLTCNDAPRTFDRVLLSDPLLASCSGSRPGVKDGGENGGSNSILDRALNSLLGEVPIARKKQEALILVAHGSRQEEGVRSLESAAHRCKQLDSPVFLGTMSGRPGLDEVLANCRSNGVKKVYLAPFMVAAGYSARREMAGDNPGSWKSALQANAIECVPVIKGLGEYDGIVDIWMDRVGTILAEFDREE